jgi:hypothetical protein
MFANFMPQGLLRALLGAKANLVSDALLLSIELVGRRPRLLLGVGNNHEKNGH